MFRISELSALNFRTDWKTVANDDICYRQRFLPTDEIKVQFTCDRSAVNSIAIVLLDEFGGLQIVNHAQLSIYDNYSIRQFKLRISDLGQYTIEIRQSSITTHTSKFCIVESFPNSILLQYDNYQDDFDTIYGPFSFRVEGIVLPSDVNFEVSNEDFRDQQYSLTQLSALPYEVHTLTVGLGQGVPNWVARKLNYIFSCSQIQMDNFLVVRSEGSTPQKTILSTDSPLFVWKIDIEVYDEASGNNGVKVESYWDAYTPIQEFISSETVITAYWDQYTPINEQIASEISSYWDQYTPIQEDIAPSAVISAYWDEFTPIQEFIAEDVKVECYYDEYTPIQEKISESGISYYIRRSDGQKYEFTPDNTMLTDIFTSGSSASSVLITGQSVAKSQIGEIVFGDNAQAYNVSFIQNAFRNYAFASRIDFSGLVNVSYGADFLRGCSVLVEINLGNIDFTGRISSTANLASGVPNRSDCKLYGNSQAIITAFKNAVQGKLSDWQEIITN